MYSCQRICFEKNKNINDFYKNFNKSTSSVLEKKNSKKLLDRKNKKELLIEDLSTENKKKKTSKLDIDKLSQKFDNDISEDSKVLECESLLKLLEKNLDITNNFLLEYKESGNKSQNIGNEEIEQPLIEFEEDITNKNEINYDNSNSYLNFVDSEIFYFCKLYDKIDYYILRIITKDVSNDEFSMDLINLENIEFYGINRSKRIIVEIVRLLNHYHTSNFDIDKDKFYFNFGNKVTYKNFSEYIYNLRKIFKSIRDSFSGYGDAKKKEFSNLLVSLIDRLMDLSLIKEIKENTSYNNFQNSLLNLSNYSYNIDKEIEFITVTGKNNIKSFKMSKNCISNLEYLKFVDKGGYFKDIYWSREGLMWKSFFSLRSPIHWKLRDGVWYINNDKLENFYNLPIEKISYYEAEAFANFYSSRLPTEKEWDFVASNRNLTLNPYGLYNPCKLDIVSDCDNIMDVNFGKISLLGFNQLYGNVWEYTSEIRLNKINNIEVCLKGGDSNVPEFLMNNSLKLFLSKDTTGLQTGFRIIKI